MVIYHLVWGLGAGLFGHDPPSPRNDPVMRSPNAATRCAKDGLIGRSRSLSDPNVDSTGAL